MGIVFDKVAVIVQQTEHRLDGKDPYAFIGHDGLGMAVPRRLSEQGPQQHGQTDLGYRLEARLFSILFQIEAASASDLWTYREQLLGWFAPYHDSALHLELNGGDVRRLDCYLVGDLNMPSGGRIGFYQKVAAQLKAPDPSFYDPTSREVSFQLGGGGGTFPVPHEVPHEVGASTIDMDVAVQYAGSWYSYPQIQIVGPITNCVITNEATGDKLDFTGVTIAAGTEYYIDLRYGYKTVVNDSGTNKIADLTSDSDLATFRLVPDSAEAPNGTNTISVVGSNINQATSVVMTYYDRYLGI